MLDRKSWKVLVDEVVRRLPKTFSLADVTAHKDYLRRHYPANRFVEAKIRQSLQVLRDQGTLRFLGNGKYERLDVAPRFSPLIDPSSAAAYTSQSQVGRVMLETWAEFNLYCVNCAADALTRLPANTPVADFACDTCEDRFQLKSTKNRFKTTVQGAAFGPTVAAARDHSMPEFVLVEYDPRYHTVIFVDALPGRLITEERVIPREKLGPNARRAGWQGCNIDITGLPRARIVEPAGKDRSVVRAFWRQITES
jgi:uncharacterized protein YlaI